jgi:23S rRNA (uracil1939-C5)-methyltransferase
VNALCRHFGTCGGCAYQDMQDDAYRALKTKSITDALARHGLTDIVLAHMIEVAPGTRRRASFKAAKRDGAVLLGFHAAASHDIVDMQECRLLTPELFAIVAGLRAMMTELLDEGQKAELFVTETGNGADVAIQWSRPAKLTNTTIAARWASRLKLARVTANGELLVELAAPIVEIGTALVTLPRNGFLQPTREGEAVLQALVLEGAKRAKVVADLFAGSGTFALVLAGKARVHAVEADGAVLDALAAAARAATGLKPLTVERRDLFKLPLQPHELARFDAVVLDPPRVGALAQAKELARSKIRRIVYVSCNPESFARDARILLDAGYKMGTVTPVDQFLWSSHSELVTTFTRD